MCLNNTKSELEFQTTKKFICFDEIDSTNLYLKEQGKQNNFPVVFAFSQTNGMGRTGKSFHSKEGVYFSVPYILTGNETKLPYLSLVTGLAVSKAIDTLYNTETKIKWPNDVYLNEKKLCGILVQTIWGKTPFCVVGIGINVDNTQFPSEIEKIATSLLLCGIKADKIQLTSKCINELDSLVNSQLVLERDSSKVLDEIKKRSYTLGKTVTASNIQGTAIDILPDGSLVIETTEGIKTVTMGEVNIQ